MLKIILKHKIIETCIDALFDSCISSFSAPEMEKSNLRYDLLEFLYVLNGSDTIIRQYRNCIVKDSYWCIDKHASKNIVFDADILFTTIYKDGCVIDYKIEYEPKNEHASTRFLQKAILK